MTRPNEAQRYLRYRMKPGGKPQWLPIGPTYLERLIAVRQLRGWGAVGIRTVTGKPQGPIRTRPRGK